jgi:integrase
MVLPATVTKNKRPHLVPLVQPAVELLVIMKALVPNSPNVFPGPNGRPLNWIHKASNKILDLAGIEDARHHDTRRVIQTNMAELGVAPHVADMILNHAVKGAPRSRTTCTTMFRRSETRSLDGSSAWLKSSAMTPMT